MIELESAPTELADDTVLEALFRVPAEPLSNQHVRTKRHRSSHTIEAGDDARARRKEYTELERSRRDS